jgi:putative FmdB family regulatory protein
MPNYSYECSNCNHTENRIVLFSKKDEQLCGNCQEHTEYKPSFNIGGVLGLPNGFAATRSTSIHKKPIGGADTK